MKEMSNNQSTHKGLLLILLLIPLLFSCSFSSSHNSSFISLPNKQLPYQLELLSKDPEVYTVVDPIIQGEKVFLSLVEECSKKQPIPLEATTRQLFIGIRELTIKKQSEEKIAGHSFLFTRASGNLDNANVELLSVSVATKDCVRDALFWTTKEAQNEKDLLSVFQTENQRTIQLLLN